MFTETMNIWVDHQSIPKISQCLKKWLTLCISWLNWLYEEIHLVHWNENGPKCVPNNNKNSSSSSTGKKKQQVMRRERVVCLVLCINLNLHWLILYYTPKIFQFCPTVVRLRNLRKWRKQSKTIERFILFSVALYHLSYDSSASLVALEHLS